VIGFVRGHAVAIGKLPMDIGMKVGKRGSEDFVELSRAVLVRRASRLRRVVEKIIGEEFLEHFEIPAALHLLGVAANDSLRGFACFAGGHDLLQGGLSVLPSVKCAGLRPGACLLAEKLKLPRQREAGAAAALKENPGQRRGLHSVLSAFDPKRTRGCKQHAAGQVAKPFAPASCANLREHAV
jgi:hypothetical protein